MNIVHVFTRRLQKMHPGSLIRSVQVTDLGGDEFQVVYLKIHKDDSYNWCKLVISITERGRM